MVFAWVTIFSWSRPIKIMKFVWIYWLTLWVISASSRWIISYSWMQPIDIWVVSDSLYSLFNFLVGFRNSLLLCHYFFQFVIICSEHAPISASFKQSFDLSIIYYLFGKLRSCLKLCSLFLCLNKLDLLVLFLLLLNYLIFNMMLLIWLVYIYRSKTYKPGSWNCWTH